MRLKRWRLQRRRRRRRLHLEDLRGSPAAAGHRVNRYSMGTALLLSPTGLLLSFRAERQREKGESKRERGTHQTLHVVSHRYHVGIPAPEPSQAGIPRQVARLSRQQWTIRASRLGNFAFSPAIRLLLLLYLWYRLGMYVHTDYPRLDPLCFLRAIRLSPRSARKNRT